MGDPKKTKKDLTASLDALLGVPESVDQEATARSLDEAGVDREDLNSRMIDRLKEQAKPYWVAQKPLPPLLESALSQFKAAADRDYQFNNILQEARQLTKWERMFIQLAIIAVTIGLAVLIFGGN